MSTQGERLKEVMTAENLVQTELANLSGESTASISRMINDTQRISIDVLEAIYDAGGDVIFIIVGGKMNTKENDRRKLYQLAKAVERLEDNVKEIKQLSKK